MVGDWGYDPVFSGKLLTRGMNQLPVTKWDDHPSTGHHPKVASTFSLVIFQFSLNCSFQVTKKNTKVYKSQNVLDMSQSNTAGSSKSSVQAPWNKQPPDLRSTALCVACSPTWSQFITARSVSIISLCRLGWV